MLLFLLFFNFSLRKDRNLQTRSLTQSAFTQCPASTFMNVQPNWLPYGQGFASISWKRPVSRYFMLCRLHGSPEVCFSTASPPFCRSRRTKGASHTLNKYVAEWAGLRSKKTVYTKPGGRIWPVPVSVLTPAFYHQPLEPLAPRITESKDPDITSLHHFTSKQFRMNLLRKKGKKKKKDYFQINHNTIITPKILRILP